MRLAELSGLLVFPVCLKYNGVPRVCVGKNDIEREALECVVTQISAGNDFLMVEVEAAGHPTMDGYSFEIGV